MLSLTLPSRPALAALLLFIASPFHSGRAASDPRMPEKDKFPLIFFAVPDSDKAFKDIAQWGGTHVHTYSSGLSIEKDRSYFDRAEKHGLKVMANLKGQQRLEQNIGLDALGQYVKHFSAHPALGIWYLYDEPTTKHTPAEIQPLYDLLKKETPELPVGIALNWTDNWAIFPSILDIALPDAYPVTGAPFPNASLHQISNFTRDILEVYPTTMPVLQIMNWKVLAKAGEKELRRYPVKDLRYPNAVEMRYMAFSSIAMGAQGLGFYSYARLIQDDPGWGAKVLAPVLKEVRAFTTEASGAKVHRIRSAEDDETYVTVFENGGQRWVILANAWPAPRKVARNPGELIGKGATLSPWGGTRPDAGTLDQGVIIADVEPWEILIWRVERAD